jgi:hypothetical protein
VLRLAVLIVDLDELDLSELPEIHHHRLGDRVPVRLRRAAAAQVHARDAVCHLQPVKTGETALDGGPAVAVSFSGARPFEVFRQHHLRKVGR